jgi:lysophospholipase L1-like esterase
MENKKHNLIFLAFAIMVISACAPPAPFDSRPVITSTVAKTLPTATALPQMTPTPTCDGILRIMPLGDSITFGETATAYGGYENALQSSLAHDGFRFDLVGSQKSPSKIIPDIDHEGHPGWSISALKDRIDQEGWLEAYQPEIILLHIGTNDIRHGNGIYAAESLSALLDDILTRLPEAHIIVAQIIPYRWGATQGHKLYNEAIPDIVSSKGERVSLVDMQSLLEYKDYTGSIHPNKYGYDKIGTAWEKAILALGDEVACYRNK